MTDDQLSRDLEAAAERAMLDHWECPDGVCADGVIVAAAVAVVVARGVLPVVLAAIDQAVTTERERIRAGIVDAPPGQRWKSTTQPNPGKLLPVPYLLALLNNEEPTYA